MEVPERYVVSSTNGPATVYTTEKLKLYSEFIRLQVAAFAILYEIITGVRPPKLKDLLRR
jgi:hypothetical protein